LAVANAPALDPTIAKSAVPVSVFPKKSAKMTLWPLVAATFFMVSGGTYGIEDVVHGAGYGRAILILLLTPILWSLPTAYMIGELSSALPAEGGFYAWVRRAMGDFWGFQEAWLSLVASIFDMAIYPTLFVPDAAVSVVWREQSRHRGGIGCGHRLRRVEHRGHSRGGDNFRLAVLFAIGPVRVHRDPGAI
jgi:amino acid transporter